MQLANIRAAVNAALGHTQHMVGNAGGHVTERVQADLKSLEITAVHADNVGPALQRASQLLFIVDFAQCVEVQGAGKIEQAPERFVVQRSQNQQDGIGMMGACFGDLKFVDDEVFAQAWQLGSGRSFQQISQRSVKELFIGEQ